VELLVLLLVAAVVTAIIISGAYLTCQQVQDYCALQAKREELVARLINSRLGKMLRSLNISLRDYLQKFPVSAINRQLGTCQNCDATAACDSYLADEGRDAASAREFCQNTNEFDDMREGTRENTA
jgi:hypothetical protein